MSFPSGFKLDKVENIAILSACGIVGIVAINKVFGTNPIGRSAELLGKLNTIKKKDNIKINDKIGEYNQLHNGEVSDRNQGYTTLVDNYYELATQFYEWGWGTSFHFANQLKGESFQQSIARHEYYLAGRLGLKKGDRVLDCGCGIGGPMRNIARFTHANIIGVTLNQQQVDRGNELNRAAGLHPEQVQSGKNAAALSEEQKKAGIEMEMAATAKSVKGNFMELTKIEGFSEGSFDGVYAIEATCHAPVREIVYHEIIKVLKPGAYFACYEWCLTDLHKNENQLHQKIKKEIEKGDGLPDIATTGSCRKAIESVGFKLIEQRDCALDNRFGGDPWYLPLYPSSNPFTFRFQMTEFGKFITKNFVWVLEKLWLAPPDTYKVQEMLQCGGWGCAQGGFHGTFTPMYLMVAQKPLDWKSPAGMPALIEAAKETEPDPAKIEELINALSVSAKSV